jgi:hypothetical protein
MKNRYRIISRGTRGGALYPRLVTDLIPKSAMDVPIKLPE